MEDNQQERRADTVEDNLQERKWDNRLVEEGRQEVVDTCSNWEDTPSK